MSDEKCNCKVCQILEEIDPIVKSLFHLDSHDLKKPPIYFKYPDDTEKEIAYQRGRKAGLYFRFNETIITDASNRIGR